MTKDKTDAIADAFYDEDYKKLEELTGIKATNQYDFETEFDKVKK